MSEFKTNDTKVKSPSERKVYIQPELKGVNILTDTQANHKAGVDHQGAGDNSGLS